MSQERNILDHLRRVGYITPREALDTYGCFRLAARVRGLRLDGHDIRTETVRRDGKRFARYVMARPAQGELF